MYALEGKTHISTIADNVNISSWEILFSAPTITNYIMILKG
jgi:hypothetical protein